MLSCYLITYFLLKVLHMHQDLIINKGTDIALRDLQQMQKGVKVVAPISGVIEAKRNDIDDINVRNIGRASIKGIECGNGVVISNKEIEAQFCHMKKDSINFICWRQG